MSKSILHTLAASAFALSMALPAFAQSSLVLGQRPIKRTEVVQFVRKQFAQMDTNHDGRVSFEEAEAYRARQGSKADTGLGYIGRHWIEKCDTNGDGTVSLQEAEGRPLHLFDMADVNRDGIASVDEQSVATLFSGG